MNARIKELLEQCQIETYYFATVGVNGELLDGELLDVGFNAEKFAELIVRECSQIANNSHPDDLPFVGGKMLVHFGVE